MALLGALAKFGMGMLHGDGNTRQCMATAVVAYKQAFGFDAPPYTYADFEESDVIVLVGSNLCIAHPILWQRVMRNPHQPGDHRHRSAGDRNGDGGHAASGRCIRSRTWRCSTASRGCSSNATGSTASSSPPTPTGFDDFAAVRATRSRSSACRRGNTAVGRSDRDSSPGRFTTAERVSFWWTMGVNQSHQGVRTAQAIINLALMTGNIGRPGTGANSITGQCNAMGSRLFSNTTNLLGGHDFANPQHRRKVADVLGIDESTHSATKRVGPTTRSSKASCAAKIRGLWVIAHQPGPLVDQPGHGSATFSIAARLPRRAGHVHNDRDGPAGRPGVAGRRLGRKGRHVHQLRTPHRRRQESRTRARAGARRLSHLQADRRILGLRRDVSRVGIARSGVSDAQATLSAASRATSRASTTTKCSTIAAAFNGRIPTGQIATSRRNDDCSPTAGSITPTAGHGSSATSRDRCPRRRTRKYPFLLLTGRGSAAQWHTQTRTAKSAVLRKLYPAELYVEVNPHDASELKIRPGDWITVSSQRGSLQAKAVVVHTVPPRQVFVPMHYAATNLLTDAVFDPYSFQPAYKACAVHLERCTSHAGSQQRRFARISPGTAQQSRVERGRFMRSINLHINGVGCLAIECFAPSPALHGRCIHVVVNGSKRSITRFAASRVAHFYELWFGNQRDESDGFGATRSELPTTRSGDTRSW